MFDACFWLYPGCSNPCMPSAESLNFIVTFSRVGLKVWRRAIRPKCPKCKPLQNSDFVNNYRPVSLKMLVYRLSFVSIWLRFKAHTAAVAEIRGSIKDGASTRMRDRCATRETPVCTSSLAHLSIGVQMHSHCMRICKQKLYVYICVYIYISVQRYVRDVFGVTVSTSRFARKWCGDPLHVQAWDINAFILLQYVVLRVYVQM